MTKSQKEYFLREQIRAIKNELGDTDSKGEEIGELKEKIAACKMPPEVEQEVPQAARPPGAHAPGCFRSVDAPHLHRLADRDAVEQVHDGQSRPRARQGHPRRGSLQSPEDQRTHPRIPGRPQIEGQDEGPDPLLRRPSRASARPRSAARSRARWDANSFASRSAA